MNVTVKDLPEAAARSLKRQAAEQGRSFNREMVHVLVGAAEEADRRRSLRASRPELDRFRSRLRPLASSVALIRSDRRLR